MSTQPRGTYSLWGMSTHPHNTTARRDLVPEIPTLWKGHGTHPHPEQTLACENITPSRLRLRSVTIFQAFLLLLFSFPTMIGKSVRHFESDVAVLTLFQNARDLRNHLNTHDAPDGKPFVCKNCNKRFVCERYARICEKSHAGDMPFICVSCGKWAGDLL